MPRYKPMGGEPTSTRKLRPALTPEAKENQMISLAMDAAEKQLRAGTASAQVITHFLKLGSSREELEKEKIRNETSLLGAKKRDIESNEHKDAIYQEALNAFKSYSGNSSADTLTDPTLDEGKKHG